MNKKQRESKRKNARAHQTKVRDLEAQREQARIARGPITQRQAFKAERVIVPTEPSPIDKILMSHGLATVNTLIPLQLRNALAARLEQSPKELELLSSLADLCEPSLTNTSKETEHGQE